MLNILLNFMPDAVNEHGHSTAFAMVPTVFATSKENVMTIYEAMQDPRKFLVAASLGVFEPSVNSLFEVSTHRFYKTHAGDEANPIILAPAFDIIKFLTNKPKNVNLILDTTSIWGLGYDASFVKEKWNSFITILASKVGVTPFTTTDDTVLAKIPGTNFHEISWSSESFEEGLNFEELKPAPEDPSWNNYYLYAKSYLKIVYGLDLENDQVSDDLKEKAFAFASQKMIFTCSDLFRLKYSQAAVAKDGSHYIEYFNDWYNGLAEQGIRPHYHLYTRFFLRSGDDLRSGNKLHLQYGYNGQMASSAAVAAKLSGEHVNRLIDCGIFTDDGDMIIKDIERLHAEKDAYREIGKSLFNGISINDKRGISNIEVPVSTPHNYMNTYNSVLPQMEDETNIPAYEKEFGIPLPSPLALFESKIVAENANDLDVLNAAFDRKRDNADEGEESSTKVEDDGDDDEDIEDAIQDEFDTAASTETEYFGESNGSEVSHSFKYDDDTTKYTTLSSTKYMGAGSVFGDDARYVALYQGEYSPNISKAKYVQPFCTPVEFREDSEVTFVDPSIITDFYRYREIISAPAIAFNVKKKGAGAGTNYVLEDIVGHASNNDSEFNYNELAFYGAASDFLADCIAIENLCFTEEAFIDSIKNSYSVVGNKYLSNIAGQVYSSHWIHTNYDAYNKVNKDSDDTGVTLSKVSMTLQNRIEESIDDNGNPYCISVSDSAGYADSEAIEKARIAKMNDDFAQGPVYIQRFISQNTSVYNIWANALIQVSRWGERKQSHLNLNLGYKPDSNNVKPLYLNFNTCKISNFDGSFENLEYKVLATRNGEDKYEEVIGIVCISLKSNNASVQAAREKAIAEAYPDLTIDINGTPYLPIAVQVQKTSEDSKTSALLAGSGTSSYTVFRNIEIFNFIELLKTGVSPFSNVYTDDEGKIVVEADGTNGHSIQVIPFTESEYDYISNGAFAVQGTNNFMRGYNNVLGARRTELDTFTLFMDFRHNPFNADAKDESGFNESIFETKLKDGLSIATDPATDLQKTALRGPLAEVFYKLFHNYLTLGAGIRNIYGAGEVNGDSAKLAEFFNSIEFNSDFDENYADAVGLAPTDQVKTIFSKFSQIKDATDVPVLSTPTCGTIKFQEVTGAYYATKIPLKNNRGYLIVFSDKDVEYFAAHYNFKPFVANTQDFSHKAENEAIAARALSLVNTLLDCANSGKDFDLQGKKYTVLCATNRTRADLKEMVK